MINLLTNGDKKIGFSTSHYILKVTSPVDQRLYVKDQTINILEINIEKIVSLTWMIVNFIQETPKAKKGKMIKFNCIKMKTSV